MNRYLIFCSRETRLSKQEEFKKSFRILLVKWGNDLYLYAPTPSKQAGQLGRTVFTTLHFLSNLQMGQYVSVTLHQDGKTCQGRKIVGNFLCNLPMYPICLCLSLAAFPAQCNVTLQHNGPIFKLRRKLRFVYQVPSQSLGW